MKKVLAVFVILTMVVGIMGSITQTSLAHTISQKSIHNRISVGLSHTVALKDDETVWAWGSNENGQLGDGTNNDSSIPVQVIGLTDVVAISAGSKHTVALKEDGTVWTWGWNLSGQLGNGDWNDSSTPVQVTGLTDVVAITAGSGHTVVLKEDGTVWAWGCNRNGELGIGTTTNMNNTPVQVTGLTDVVQISAQGGWGEELGMDIEFYGHTYAIKKHSCNDLI